MQFPWCPFQCCCGAYSPSTVTCRRPIPARCACGCWINSLQHRKIYLSLGNCCFRPMGQCALCLPGTMPVCWRSNVAYDSRRARANKKLWAASSTPPPRGFKFQKFPKASGLCAPPFASHEHSVMLHHHAIIAGLVGAELTRATVEHDGGVAEIVHMLQHPASSKSDRCLGDSTPEAAAMMVAAGRSVSCTGTGSWHRSAKGTRDEQEGSRTGTCVDLTLECIGKVQFLHRHHNSKQAPACSQRARCCLTWGLASEPQTSQHFS